MARKKDYYNYLLLLVTIFILSACGHGNNSSKLIKKLNQNIEKNYKIDKGYLIALYGLHNTTKNNLYNQEYQLIINNPKETNNFLSRLKKSYNINVSKLIVANVNQKQQQICSKLTLLKEKYHLPLMHNLRHSLLCKSSNIHKGEHVLRDLYQLDLIMQKLPLMSPLRNAIITSPYGQRIHPITKKKKFHQGIDLAAHKSAPIYAAANGKIVSICRTKTYGNMIEIKHNYGFSSRYAHLGQIIAHENDHVIRGQEIAKQGKTGQVTKEHLHYELLYDKQTIDPLEWLKS